MLFQVPYEQLVLHPRQWMEKILSFLDLPWTEAVMHHEEQINKKGGISLSKVERSSDQVSNYLNWVHCANPTIYMFIGHKTCEFGCSVQVGWTHPR